MRSIKLLGLAAMATMVATAFVGVSSAMAEPEHPEIVLCEAAELICENPYPSPTEIHFETLPDHPPLLLTSIGNIECEHSLATVTLLNKLAKLIEGHLSALNFSGNCQLGGLSCTITVSKLGGLSFTPDKEKLKSLVQTIPLEGVETEGLFKCGSLFKCTYHTTEETELLAQTDAEGHLLLLFKATRLKSLGFCPEIFDWDAEYHAVNLDEELSLRTGLWIEL